MRTIKGSIVRITLGVLCTLLSPVQAQISKVSGMHGVSPTGAATYRIPLLPLARAGELDVPLALVYDSQRIHSSQQSQPWLSRGWRLEGLSSIKHCRSTVAQNGVAAPSSVTGKFCLNDNQLILQSGGYGQAGSTYRTELDVFARITAVGTAGSGPQSFKVEGKDGLIYSYGSASGRVTSPGSAETHEWMLDKVADRSGNNVTVEYENGRPSEVNTGLGFIRLIYTSNPARLTSIEYIQPILSGSVHDLTHRYELTYAPSPVTGAQRLSSIKLCYAPALTCGPATQITYQNGHIGVQDGVSIATGNVVETRAADVDGDGKEEILYATQEGSQLRWWLRFYNGAAVNTGILTPAAGLMLAEDFLGTGSMQLLALVNGAWSAYRWNGASLSAVSLSLPVDSYGSNELLAPDIDGDGRYDLVWLTEGGLIHSRLNQSVGGSLQFGSKVSFNLAPNLEPMVVAWRLGRPMGRVRPDFDGDGRGDVVITGILAYSYLDEACYAETGSEYCLVTDMLAYRTALFARSNGTFEAGGGESDSNIHASRYTSFGYENSVTGYYFASDNSLPVDWNQDGQMDGLVPWGSTFVVYSGYGYTSTGIPVSGTAMLTALDHDGDGQFDLIRSGPSGISLHLHNTPSQHPDVVQTVADGYGIEATFSYTSTAQDAYSRTWSGVADTVYPIRESTLPRYVVKQVTASDGTGGTYQQSFHYAAAREELRGRGFSGFAIRRSHDSRTGFYAVEKRHTHFPFTGMIESATTYRSNQVTPVSLTTTVPAPITLTSANTHFPRIQSSTTQRFEVGGAQDGQQISTHGVSYTYGEYGNLTQLTATHTDTDSDSPWVGQSGSTTVVNAFALHPATWCVGLPERTTVTRTLPDGTMQTSVTENVLDTDLTHCRFQRVIVEPDGSASLRAVTEWMYHGCGRPLTQTVTGYEDTGAQMTARATTYNYTPNAYGVGCGSLTSVTNALGQTYSSEVHVALSEVTDANGVTRKLENQFGRPHRETRGDGSSTTWAYELCTSANQFCNSNLSDVRWAMVQSEGDAPCTSGGTCSTFTSKRAWYDGFNRVRRAAHPTSAGGWTYVDTTYDTLGRVRTVSNPYSVASNGFARYHYDSLSRPTLTELVTAANVVDRQSSVVYAGRQTAITDAKGNTTHRTFDVIGALRRVQDPSPGGLTRYDYSYSNNHRVDTITDPAQNALMVTTNVRGFKVSQTEKNLGTTSWSYNSLGELRTKKDGNNDETSYVYDALGRVIERHEADGNTVYTWGVSATENNIGKLASISSPGGYAEHYEYDDFGRAKTVRYAYAGIGEYRYDYGYDLYGRLHTRTYPQSIGTRFTAEYVYANGHLTQVKEQNGSVFWTLNAQNESARPIDEMLGNGVHIITGFNPLTGEMEYRQSGNGGSVSNLQDFAYQWDMNGNLTERRSINQGLIETFGYDSLNRLSSAQVNIASKTFNYDALGNLTYKSDVGSYTYHPTKSNAVATAGGVQYGYDADGNMTSRNGGTNNVNWTSYNYPSQITQGNSSSTFLYGAHRNRFKQVATFNGQTETTIYAGGLFEAVTVPSGTFYRHYLRAGSTQVVVTKSASTTIVSYVTGDHLSSSAVLTDSAGGLIAYSSFDAFGKRRNGATWSGPPPAGELQAIANVTRRGFTGHEHLDNLNLIHMNGRVYDPNLAKFLSADPNVPYPDVSQSFNRYSYTRNNPLAWIDPSGFEDCFWGQRRGPSGTCEKIPLEEMCELSDACVRGTPDQPEIPDPNDLFPPDPSQGDPINGGGGDGSGGAQENNDDRCKPNYVKAASGLIGTVLGGAQAISGTISALIGAVGTFTPASPVGISAAVSGVGNMIIGGANVHDGIAMMRTAFDGQYRESAFENLGSRIGGPTGQFVTDYVSMAANYSALAHNAVKAASGSIDATLEVTASVTGKVPDVSNRCD